MSDIVERLRGSSWLQRTYSTYEGNRWEHINPFSEVPREAADTIEQMREAMRQIALALHEAGHTPKHGQSLADALRAALSAPAPAPAEPVATVTECEACFTPDTCQLRGTCDHYSAERLRVAKQEAAALARFGDWTMLPLIATEPMQKAMQRAVMLRKSMNDVWRAAIGEAPESPVSAPDGEPDWSDVLAQAEAATGLKVERHTYSIVIREVRKWLKGAAPAAPAGWQPIETVNLAELDGPLWLALRNRDVVVGTYEWRQGWNPDGFNTIDRGRVGLADVTHCMPYAAPGAPQGDAA